MTTRRKQLNNIRKLIAVAEEFRDSRTKLDMRSWVAVEHSEAKSLTRQEALEGACGTTFCLAGRAGLEPHFRKQGLRTDFIRAHDGNIIERFSSPGWPGGYAPFALFGLAVDQGSRTFYHPNLLTPAGRISKKRTLNAIIKNLKNIAFENFGVEL